MDKELKNGQMDLNMKVSMQGARRMAKENYILLMAVFTKAFLLIMR